jgi:hypothetical protein
MAGRWSADWDAQMLYFLCHGFRVIARHALRRFGAAVGQASEERRLENYKGFPHGMPPRL